jgi:hypothetical protein
MESHDDEGEKQVVEQASLRSYLLQGFILKRSLHLALAADEKLRLLNQLQNHVENSMPELEASASPSKITWHLENFRGRKPGNTANSKPMVVPKGLPVAGDVVDEAAKRYPDLTPVANEKLGQLDQLQKRAPHDSFSLLQSAATSTHSNSTLSSNQNSNELNTCDATVGSIASLTYLPPLDDVLDAIRSDSNLTAGQIALDFAIIGFPKCGTSTLSKLKIIDCGTGKDVSLTRANSFVGIPPPPGVVHWLGGHPEVAAFQQEIMILQRRNAADLIRRIYKGFPDGPFKRG